MSKLAFTLIYLVVKEGDSGRAWWGGGMLRNPSPSPFFLALIPFPFNAYLASLPRRRSYGFVTQSWEERLLDEPVRTSAWEATATQAAIC